MKLTIEGDSLIDIEEKVIDLAEDIVERRTLPRQGCTCDLRKPAREVVGEKSRLVRCTIDWAVCDARKTRLSTPLIPGVPVELPKPAAA